MILVNSAEASTGNDTADVACQGIILDGDLTTARVQQNDAWSAAERRSSSCHTAPPGTLQRRFPSGVRAPLANLAGVTVR
jgi:hypothetical protein